MNMHKLLKVKHPDTEEKYVCYIEQLHKNCVLHWTVAQELDILTWQPQPGISNRQQKDRN